MTSGIVSLPRDLQFLIISNLEPIVSDKKNYDSGNYQENVPQEEKGSQVQSDLWNLSSTCTFYRTLLAPRIFRKIILRDDRSIVASVEAAIARNVSIKDYVRELWFAGQPGEVKEEEDEKEERSQQDGEVKEEEEEEEEEEEGLQPDAVFKILPPASHSLLSNLDSYFPYLSTLSLELNFPLDPDEDENDLSVFEVQEYPDEVLSKECDDIRRAYLAKVYSAIAENYANNKRSQIKKLELKDVMPKEVSTWRTPTWHTFLEQLESFEISMVGGYNSTGWDIDNLEGYHAFIPKLASFFFDHLLNTTSLTLRASEDFPLGLEGGLWGLSPLPLAHDSLPNLRELTLEKCFFGPELSAFLSAHAQRLESVRLEDCMTSVNGMANNGIHWHTLFDSVAESAPGRLRTFVVVPEEVRYITRWPKDEGTDGVMEVRRLLDEDKQAGGMKRCFNYKIVDGGMLYDDDEEITGSFMRGEDQRAWERLMRIVEPNNKC